MYNKKTLTFTFHHYWGAFCQGAFFWGAFVLDPVLTPFASQFIHTSDMEKKVLIKEVTQSNITD